MTSTADKGAVEIRILWRGARRAQRRGLCPPSGRLAVVAGIALAAAVGCGGTTVEGSNGGTGHGGSGASGGGGSATTAGGAGGSGNTGGSTTGSGGTTSTTTTPTGTLTGTNLCAQPVPAGAPMPKALPAYSGGACPSLVAGENIINSKGNDRKFILVLPSNLMPDEHPPLLFLWHWLGGTAEGFIDKGQIQQAADEQRFIGIAPRAKGDIQFHWPFSVADSDARMEEEFTFFDDMLTCVAQAYGVNTSCVGSAGVSAGALFTDQLAGHRSEYLASFLSLSGGVGGVIKPWANPAHKLPGIVLWGGPTDNCFNLLKFDQESQTLEDNLTSQGSFFVECIHNCGHSEPPLDPPADGSSIYSPLWGFVLDHPFWVGDGQSPYKADGLPANMPVWCGIGKGSATPRMGPCSGGGC